MPSVSQEFVDEHGRLETRRGLPDGPGLIVSSDEASLAAALRAAAAAYGQTSQSQDWATFYARYLRANFGEVMPNY
jgi:hypothetical protein